MTGNSKTLWQALKLAKNLGTNEIPKYMTLNGVEVSVDEISDCFVDFYVKKVSDIVSTTTVDQNVVIK